MLIPQSSPLYEYWNSEQEENDENKRLLKLNPNEPKSILFSNEPYKWENLYQCVLINIMRGDLSSIKGLIVLLSMINKMEKDKVIKSLEVFLDKRVINILRNEKYQDLETCINFFTSLRIFFCIFTNPYGLVLKKEQQYIYEKTGMISYNFRKLFFIK